MSEYHRIIIIGAGPIGLYFASKCERDRKDYVLLEASNNAGGQLLRLYPEKEIVDIEGIACIKAHEYIEMLLDKIQKKNIKINEKVISIKSEELIQVKTEKKLYTCTYLIISTGLGMSVPRPLGVEHERDAENIIYKIDNIELFKNKRVTIFGGGDSALDWAKHLSRISDNISLVHRRLEFRGNPETIKDCSNLKVFLPYVPDSIELVGNKAIRVKIKEVTNNEKSPQIINIPVDYVFVNFGNIAEQTVFDFDKDGSFLKVNPTNYSVSKNIFAIGDISSYENKKRRIQPGINEADRVYKLID